MLEHIKPIIEACAAYVNIPIIRSEQNGDAPKYPYAVYKVTEINRDKPQCGIIETKPKDGDDSKCVITFRGTCETPISLSFLHNDAHELWALIFKACDWWDDYSDELCEDLGITAKRLSDPQDRTVSLETAYEYRFGFDVKLSAYVTREREVDAIDMQSIAQQLLLQE